MEKEKKKYVKPQIKVTEWDFNEAVCDDGIMLLSKCAYSEVGRLNRYVTRENDPDWTGPVWKDVPQN